MTLLRKFITNGTEISPIKMMKDSVRNQMTRKSWGSSLLFSKGKPWWDSKKHLASGTKFNCLPRLWTEIGPCSSKSVLSKPSKEPSSSLLRIALRRAWIKKVPQLLPSKDSMTIRSPVQIKSHHQKRGNTFQFARSSQKSHIISTLTPMLAQHTKANNQRKWILGVIQPAILPRKSLAASVINPRHGPAKAKIMTSIKTTWFRANKAITSWKRDTQQQRLSPCNKRAPACSQECCSALQLLAASPKSHRQLRAVES